MKEKTKKSPAPKKASSKPRLKIDEASWGSATVHTVTVDLKEAVRLQQCGYRVQNKDANQATMAGDAQAYKRNKAGAK
tara:strand:- start:11548 stop:11781 length:234 start_codon:yes stop_codon:yes gene_type:complete